MQNPFKKPSQYFPCENMNYRDMKTFLFFHARFIILTAFKRYMYKTQ